MAGKKKTTSTADTLQQASACAEAHVKKRSTRKCPVVPFEDRLVLEIAEARDKTDGGILLPESVKSKEKPETGTVAAIGPGRPLPGGGHQAIEAVVGDVVYFAKYQGVQVPGHDRLLFIRADDVLGRVND